MMAVSSINIESKKMQEINGTDTARSAIIRQSFYDSKKKADVDAETLPAPTTSDLSGAQCANRAR
jgi:hypothetical protein